MVPKTGLEPVRPHGQRILSPLRLPIPPLGRTMNQGTGSFVGIEPTKNFFTQKILLSNLKVAVAVPLPYDIIIS